MTIPSGTLTYFGTHKFYFDKHGLITMFTSIITNLGDLIIFNFIDELPLLYIENLKYDADKVMSYGEDWSSILVNTKAVEKMLDLFKARPSNVDGYLFSITGKIILTRIENKFILANDVQTFQVNNRESIKVAIEGIKTGKRLFRVNNVYKMFTLNNKNFQMLLLPVFIKLNFEKSVNDFISEEFAYLSFLIVCKEFEFDTPSLDNFKWSLKDLLPLSYTSCTENTLNIQKTSRLERIVINESSEHNKSNAKNLKNEVFIPYKLTEIFTGDEDIRSLKNFLALGVNKPTDDCIFITDVDLIGDYVDIKIEDIMFIGIKNRKLYIALSSLYEYGDFHDKITLENLLTIDFPDLQISTYKIGGKAYDLSEM